MNNRLERYMREVEQGLQGLSETRRAQELAEIREHLEASARAHQKLGLEEKEAAEAAVAQFGPPKQVSRELRRVWWREQKLIPDTLLGTSIAAVAGFLALDSFVSPLILLLTVAMSPFVPSPAKWGMVAGMGVLQAVPPLLLGILLGWLTPRHAVKGSLIGLSTYALYHFLAIGAYVWIQSLSAAHPFSGTQARDILLSNFTRSVIPLVMMTMGAVVGRKRSRRTLA